MNKNNKKLLNVQLSLICCTKVKFNHPLHSVSRTSISGWIWTKESQKEIQEVKAKYDKDLSTIKCEMEASYRETLKERCKAVATLELELEKERQRVKGYKQAMASHTQLLMEQRKKLQQVNPQTTLSISFCFFLYLSYNLYNKKISFSLKGG